METSPAFEPGAGPPASSLLLCRWPEWSCIPLYNSPDLLRKTKQEYNRTYYEKHKEANRAKARRHYHRHRSSILEKRRKSNHGINLKAKFGITPQRYNEMLEQQGGVCAVCKQPETRKGRWTKGQPVRLAVDHCHDTGKVRGLLCAHCNTALGSFEHCPERILTAAVYLKQHEKRALEHTPH